MGRVSELEERVDLIEKVIGCTDKERRGGGFYRYDTPILPAAERLKENVTYFAKTVRDLETRIKQLECEHENLVFDEDAFVVSCRDCGKVIAKHDTLEDLLIAKLDYTKNSCGNMKAVLQCRIAGLKEG